MSRGGALDVRRLSLRIGGQDILTDVDLQAAPGALVGLVGPNGAGKTSLLNCINGLYVQTSGEIALDGRAIHELSAIRRARAGLARTFQHMHLLEGESVLQNVLVGRHLHMRRGFLSAALYLSLREERRHRAVALAALDRCGIADVAHRQVGTLPYGQRKRVDFARALAMEGCVILVDEPMAGLNPDERNGIAEVMREVQRTGTTQVMIEHDIDWVRRLVDEVVVLDFGEVIARGAPRETLAQQHVIDAYLGQEAPA